MAEREVEQSDVEVHEAGTRTSGVSPLLPLSQKAAKGFAGVLGALR